MTPSDGLRPLELSDLLWDKGPDGRRRSLGRDEVVDALLARGQRRAARLARRLPAVDGRLDEAAVDALLLRVHCELQRLTEELQQPRRVAELLRSFVEPILSLDPRPVRVVDVGCGIGYTVRWLAAHQALDERVELVGVDTNDVLVGYAAELAEAEGLRCRFRVGDAFEPGVVVDDGPRTVLMSSGLLHHLPPAELPHFFAAQQRLGVVGFAHWDPDPSGWSILGARVFHLARMREPLSRHDGVLSVRRAHPAAVLREAASAGAPGYSVECRDGPRLWPALTEVLRPVWGRRR